MRSVGDIGTDCLSNGELSNWVELRWFWNGWIGWCYAHVKYGWSDKLAAPCLYCCEGMRRWCSHGMVTMMMWSANELSNRRSHPYHLTHTDCVEKKICTLFLSCQKSCFFPKMHEIVVERLVLPLKSHKRNGLRWHGIFSGWKDGRKATDIKKILTEDGRGRT